MTVLLPAFLAAIVMLGTTAAPSGTGGSGVPLNVVDRAAGVVHVLDPGQTAEWPIGVTTNVIRLDSLNVSLTTPGGQASALDRYLLLSLLGCTARWEGTRCPATAIEVASPTRMTARQNWPASVVLPDRTVPEDIDLLLSVRLDDATPQALQGERSQVRIEVSATGELAEGLSAGGTLPNTGFGLLRSLLTGLAAIAAGLMLAGLARRRAQARPR